ncbi:uncharacterized protein LOC133179413 [Saccostrea echinata]|uniref:uncharacterized protein LOC133179413 n=1 Tax=Saccostrea echinata TaxID=191078 RepID=UPI002A83294F|nr:uncharacterized protein LOC133179413 [Saccostrea echinata]
MAKRKNSSIMEGTFSSADEGSSGTESSDYFKLIKHDKIFPTKASDWKMSHLLDLGIYYDETATELQTFMSMLKEGIPKPKLMCSDIEIPGIKKKLIQLTKDWWKFSFDFESAEKSLTGSGVRESLQQTMEAIEVFEEENHSIVESLKKMEQEDWKSLQVYSVWRMNVLEFLRYFSMLLTRWGKPYQGKERFTNLLMAFSKICFLYPEPGKTLCEIIQIKDTMVQGSPDIRFLTFPTSTSKKNSELLVVTKVQQYDAFIGDYAKGETFTFEHLSKIVLGQHGIELLIERESSFFFPAGVVGLLCIGTKVIFTFLQISQGHYQMIRERGKVDKTNRATISYTKPYDYMSATDRAEILEALYCLGFIQSNPEQFS